MNKNLGALLLATMSLCGCVSSPVKPSAKPGLFLARMDNPELQAYLAKLQTDLSWEWRILRIGCPPKPQGPEATVREKLLNEILATHIEMARIAQEIPYRGGAGATSTEDQKEENRRLCQQETDPETILKGVLISTLDVEVLPTHEIARLINREIASVCPFWRRPKVKVDAKLPPVPITLSLGRVSVWDACRLLADIANAEMVLEGRRLRLRPASPKPPPEPDGPPGVPEVPGLYNSGPNDPFANEWNDPFSRRPIDPLDPFCGVR